MSAITVRELNRLAEVYADAEFGRDGRAIRTARWDWEGAVRKAPGPVFAGHVVCLLWMSFRRWWRSWRPKADARPPVGGSR